MTRPEAGTQAPAFSLPDADEQPVTLKSMRGRWIVLYFYPKDNTSGCTLEAQTFTRLMPEFEKRQAVILGVSPDSPQSHCKFRDKHGLDIRLLSDSEHDVLEKYGVWVRKSMYGREYMGVERSTFLIDPQGEIVKVWRKVKVKGHPEEVLKDLSDKQRG